MRLELARTEPIERAPRGNLVGKLDLVVIGRAKQQLSLLGVR